LCVLVLLKTTKYKTEHLPIKSTGTKYKKPDHITENTARILHIREARLLTSSSQPSTVRGVTCR
jgi:hypothetical protein